MNTCAKTRLRALAGRLRRRIQGTHGARTRHPVLDLPPHPQKLTGCLRHLLSSQDRLRIVQIGANDGRINDPLHALVATAPERIDILLVEPQPDLIPRLRASYAFHPAPGIFNGAVGQTGHLTLYTVRRECWPRLKTIDYAEDWPEYRAPTGVTSARRDHVLRWLRTHLADPRQAEESIERLEVPCVDLPTLLARTGFPGPPDLVQIDAEGCDDDVIYNCGLDRHAPRLVRFEAKHLPDARFARLARYLGDLGYVLWRDGMEALAIHGARPGAASRTDERDRPAGTPTEGAR